MADMPLEPLEPPMRKYAELGPELKVILDIMIDAILKRGHLTKILLDRGHEMQPGYSRTAVIELIDAGVLKLWESGGAMGWLVYMPNEGRYLYLAPPEEWRS